MPWPFVSPGVHLNIKMLSYQHKDPHGKDKAVLRLSNHYLYNGNPIPQKVSQTSNIRHTLKGNKIVDHSDVIGASPLGAAPTTSSFLTSYLASMDWTKTTARWDDKGIKNGCPCIVEIRGTQGCALVGDPARAVGECRDVAKAQP